MFESSEALDSMLTSFYFFSDRFQSNIFDKIWCSTLRQASKKGLLHTITDIVTQVWEPVFAECCKLAEDLYSEEIKLKHIECYFDPRDEHMFHNIKQLSEAIKACTVLPEGQSASNSWIRTVVDKMEMYWSLCSQAEAAKTVLDLKECLRLTGNFDVIEEVADKIDTSMRESALKTIDAKVIKAKTFLEQCTGEKLHCLRAFSKCLDLIDWIRKETKG